MNENQVHAKIAIVGLSCLFPGATTPDEYWNNLINGVDSISPTTEAQFGVDPALYYDPERRTLDTTYSLRGGYVRAQVPIPEGLDKAAGWTLYVTNEALRDANLTDRADVLARCGLILGDLSFPTQESHTRVAPIYDSALESAIGDLLDAPDFRLGRTEPSGVGLVPSPASVVAARLGLGGTTFCIDAACASSLYAIDLACRTLNSGRADVMLAGAVSAADPLFVNMGFTHFGAYPDEGESRPLDADSDGLINGEGAGLVVLKRYDDAVRDGDKIYAVIGGVGLSNDGRGKHPLTPNSRGQILAFQRAYAENVDARAVQYVECHASGTPLGDKTELASMDEFFGGLGNHPRFGAVKANHGHLLTVAGLASTLKVILSMAHEVIPATMRVAQPLTSRAFGVGQIVSQNTPWTQPEKTAGVNAFGFGGVSAHLVLQNDAAHRTSAQARSVTPAASTRMAIIGMDAQFGGCDGLEAFASTIYDGETHFGPLPPKRWKGLAEDAPPGAYIDSFEVDFLRFKFPPKEDEQPTPQHLLLLKVADNAVRDAGLAEGANVVVIVAVANELTLHQYRSRLDLTWQMSDSLRAAGLDLTPDDARALTETTKNAISPAGQVNQYTSYIGNIASSRVSALWNFSGPAFTLTAAENSVFKALEVAALLLGDGNDNTIEAVVIGAVDLAGGVENVTLRRQQYPVHMGAPTLSFDVSVEGWQIGEGAGAIVLQRSATADPRRTYATIESTAIVSGTTADAASRAMRGALDAAGVSANAIAYVEASADGLADHDRAEVAALNRVYDQAATDDVPRTALGSVKANIGHTGAASGMAALIKTALCLHRRFLPAVPNWTGPKHPDEWRDEVFYVTPKSRPWFGSNGVPRYAAVSGLSEDGSSAHIVLSDANVDRVGSVRLRSFADTDGLHLFLIDGDSTAALVQSCDEIERSLDAGESLPTVAARSFTRFGRGRYRLVLVAGEADALRRELTLARKGVGAAIAENTDWSTPAGSSFTARPLGPEGTIAYVYPGAFNSYPDVGREWLHLFPSAHDYLETQTNDLAARSVQNHLYMRNLCAPNRAEIKAFRARLTNDQHAMMQSGTMLSVLYTHVIRDVFKIAPAIAFGYSQGEGTMLWSMNVWKDSDRASEKLTRSNLFTERLFGRKTTIRAAWGIPDDAPDDFWFSYVLSAGAAEVTAAISYETHVYLTHINTPNEVVIAGDPAACERVIARLGCPSLQAPFDAVTHNEMMMADFAEFYDLYSSPVSIAQRDVAFYSAADYDTLHLERDFIARSIARVSCKQIDFPRLVDRTYRDGARIFIELGPGSTCSRWINDTLKADEREHLAVAVDHLRLDDRSALVKLLARLVSHHVPMDLSPLFGVDTVQADAAKHLVRTITLGGESVREVIVSDDNRARFGRAMRSVSTPRPVRAAERATPRGAAIASHPTMLASRLEGLRALGSDLRMQFFGSAPDRVAAAPVATPPAAPPMRYAPRPAIFDTATIDQFARGSIKACFGPEYAIYDHRRAPRIPNTDLMLLSRIVEVDATRLVTKVGSSMVAEYDVPPDMWFYKDNSSPFTPYSMLMEIALQPCGFLSAFMGPTLDFPEIDFYFRNLDGQGSLLRKVDLRGRTLTNRVKMTSSTVLSGIIIQKFTFEMILDDAPLYVGSSTFGYFTMAALSSQAGLDMGKPIARWHEASGAPLVTVPGNRHDEDQTGPGLTLPVGQLAFLDDARIAVDGGKAGLGYIYGTSTIRPSDWFLACHFHQDPVMPGSLGLEAIVQSIHAWVIEAGVGRDFHAPKFGNSEGEMVWKYRGQVLGDSGAVQVEVHITDVRTTAGRVEITADASLWKGDLRIYEFKRIGVSVSESI